MPMNSQTRILVCTAFALAAVDIAVRGAGLFQNRYSGRHHDHRVVTAQEFRLTDKSGNTRATLGVDDEGNTGFLLYDRSGTVRAKLDTFDDVPSLILCDPRGEHRVYVGMEQDGSGLVQMYGENGNTITELDTSEGRPTMQFFNRNGSNHTRSFTFSSSSSDVTIR